MPSVPQNCHRGRQIVGQGRAIPPTLTCSALEKGLRSGEEDGTHEDNHPRWYPDGRVRDVVGRVGRFCPGEPPPAGWRASPEARAATTPPRPGPAALRPSREAGVRDPLSPAIAPGAAAAANRDRPAASARVPAP